MFATPCCKTLTFFDCCCAQTRNWSTIRASLGAVWRKFVACSRRVRSRVRVSAATAVASGRPQCRCAFWAGRAERQQGRHRGAIAVRHHGLGFVAAGGARQVREPRRRAGHHVKKWRFTIQRRRYWNNSSVSGVYLLKSQRSLISRPARGKNQRPGIEYAFSATRSTTRI